MRLLAIIRKVLVCMLRFLLPVFCALLMFSAPAVAGNAEAGDLRVFAPGSLQKIVAERQGKPFVLAFWSISCTHCPSELKALGALKKAHPKLDVVLVAADSPDDAPQAAKIAQSHGLGKVPQWVFADEAPERLRFEVDPRWHGELPRTYLYDRAHVVEAVSGLVPQEQLAKWVRENAR